MNGAALFPIFLTGLLGSVHCIGMCGGIVGALSAIGPSKRVYPVTVITLVTPAPVALRVASYNVGRIGSYAMAGALAGGLSQAAAKLVHISAIETILYLLANLMLVALGLYLSDAWRGLARLESAGQFLWRRIAPLLAPLLPMDSTWKALTMGALWGWLPCGMVYSVLLTAMLSGSALSGAAVMLAFGLGTLPTLLGLGLAGERLRRAARDQRVRIACGLLVAGFGVLGLLRVAGGMSLGWLDALCLTPQVHP
jgi:sulfite exporter TauE/SafE